MISQLIERIKKDKTTWPQFQDSFVEMEIPPKTVLLHDGEISCRIYFLTTMV